MERREIKELRKKILCGINLSYRKLVAAKIRHNQNLIVSEGGRVVSVNPQNINPKSFR